jgi:hypothetical protein
MAFTHFSFLQPGAKGLLAAGRNRMPSAHLHLLAAKRTYITRQGKGMSANGRNCRLK